MTQKDSFPFGLNSEDNDELSQLLPSYPTHNVIIKIHNFGKAGQVDYCHAWGLVTR